MDQITQNNIQETDVPDMMEKWIEWFDDLDDSRPDNIRVPFRYDTKIVSERFLDFLAENKFQAKFEEEERQRLKMERIEREKRNREREEKRYRTVEELKDFAPIFDFYIMNEWDITNYASNTKDIIKAKGIDESQWQDFIKYWSFELKDMIEQSESTSLNKCKYEVHLKETIRQYLQKEKNPLPY